MNERFENLAEEAMVHVPGSKGLHTRAFSLEKFAELIVKECIIKLTPYLDDQFIDDIESELKEHFGIVK